MSVGIEDRALGAIIGAAVADAAAQPLHWIYDLKKLQNILSETPFPEFRVQSANPFYRRKTGQQSCYGDQAFVLLESLAECGVLNIEDLKERTYTFFGPGSEYDSPVNQVDRPKGGPRPQLPIEGPWRHASLKSFLKNYENKKKETGCDIDRQIDGISKLAPIVAMYAGKPELLEKVEQATRVTQNDDVCVSLTLAGARLLEYYVLHGSSEKALDCVLEQLQDEHQKHPEGLDQVVAGHLQQVKAFLSKPPEDVTPAVFTNT
uniref:Selenoprotein J n=2 Tax=Erpetoichthys calabaricus TaxID=27687 RepID=A0A8C4SMZ4_ERPCA